MKILQFLGLQSSYDFPNSGPDQKTKKCPSSISASGRALIEYDQIEFHVEYFECSILKSFVKQHLITHNYINKD